MTAIGLGILAMPRALAESGWVSGLLSLFLSAVVAGFGCLILWKATFLNPDSRDTPMSTFEEIGRVSFGKAGATISSLLLHTLLIFVCAVLLVVLASSLLTLTRTLNLRLWILICGVICLPLSWIKHMKEVGLVAAFGVATVAAAVICIMCACIAAYIGEESTPDYQVSSGSPLVLVSTFNTFLLSFTVSVTEPTIISAMEKPQDFPKALLMAFTFILCVYAGVSVLGYLAFGDTLLNRDTIVEAIAPPGTSLSAVAWIINIVMLLLVAVHLLVLFMPTAHFIDSLLRLDDMKRWNNPTRAGIVRILTRSLQLCVCVVLGVGIPSVDRLVGILAAFCIIVLSVVLPMAFYIRLKYLNKEPFNKIELALVIFLLVLSPAFIGTGLYEAVTS
uniref:Amino acid transporter transmembrane domain-containing protein n=1 Tax=Oxyrrhis marina TaxID=2969 RepID=A0A7S3UKP7_OXYMA